LWSYWWTRALAVHGYELLDVVLIYLRVARMTIRLLMNVGYYRKGKFLGNFEVTGGSYRNLFRIVKKLSAKKLEILSEIQGSELQKELRRRKVLENFDVTEGIEKFKTLGESRRSKLQKEFKKSKFLGQFEMLIE
jgi:hypothetical protein